MGSDDSGIVLFHWDLGETVDGQTTDTVRVLDTRGVRASRHFLTPGY